MSVSQNLKEGREEVSDEGLVEIVDEALENQDSLAREVDEPTLKHGTDTANYEGILDEGLVPGEENSSETGESGQGGEVALSTSLPVALRYAELTEAAKFLTEAPEFSSPEEGYGSVQSPMIVEMPASSVEQASIDSRNESAVNSVLGTDLNPYQSTALANYLQEDNSESFPFFGGSEVIERAVDGDERAREVVLSMVGDGYGEVSALIDEGVFGEISHNEVEGDFLQEVNTPEAPVNEDAVIYVPRNQVEAYRQRADELGFEGEVYSIEARAVVHEERMKDVYEDNGTLNFVHPADGGFAVNVLDTDGTVPYDESSDVVDISRLRGEPLYDGESKL
ncbi:MAG: hypothetical protein ABEJ87_03930 [Candidatus Nanohalobium sp.]